MIGHTIWIRSAGVIAAQASGSLSPRLPTHSAAVVARTVSPPRSCPEDSCGEDDIENDYTLRAKSMRKELRPLFLPIGLEGQVSVDDRMLLIAVPAAGSP